MRCMACDGEMLLVSVLPDESMIVAGFERCTLQCLSCDEIEQRTVFTRPADPPPPNGFSGLHSKSAIASATAGTRDERAAAVTAIEPKALPMSSAWIRAVVRLRERQAAVAERAVETAKAERVTAFYRSWENLIPPRRQPLFPPPKAKMPQEIRAAVRPPPPPDDEART